MRITEKELLRTEATRQEALDALLKDVGGDIEVLVARHGSTIRQLIQEGALNTDDMARIDRVLRRTSDATAQSLTESLGQRYPAITEIEKSFFAEISLSTSVTAEEYEAVFSSFVQNMETSFLELTHSNRDTLRRMIRESVGGDMSSENLIARLAGENDKLATYAETIGNTSMNAVSQDYNTISARSAGLKHALYAGNILPATRDFCRELVGKVLTIEAIRKLQNGQIEPVLTYCGGYNCRHRWVWVDPEWIA